MDGDRRALRSGPVSRLRILVAEQAADGETALEAVERIVATYDVDAMEMRLDCARGLADAAKLSSQHAALAEQVYSLVDVALAEDDFEAAGQFGEIAEASAKRGRNYSLVKEVVARLDKLDELRQAHAEYQKAQARLDESPTDPEANLAAGRYLCLSRGDWDQGIPMLALGGDPALRVPAVKELVGADSPDAQVALGDTWWDVAQSREGRERDCFLLRAGHWYEKARSQGTSGLVKVKLDQRLAEIAKIEPPAGQVAGTRSGPKSRPAVTATVRPFDPTAAVLLATLPGHASSVRSIGFSPDGSTLAVADAGTVEVLERARDEAVAPRQPSPADLRSSGCATRLVKLFLRGLLFLRAPQALHRAKETSILELCGAPAVTSRATRRGACRRAGRPRRRRED